MMLKTESMFNEKRAKERERKQKKEAVYEQYTVRRRDERARQKIKNKTTNTNIYIRTHSDTTLIIYGMYHTVWSAGDDDLNQEN